MALTGASASVGGGGPELIAEDTVVVGSGNPYSTLVDSNVDSVLMAHVQTDLGGERPYQHQIGEPSDAGDFNWWFRETTSGWYFHMATSRSNAGYHYEIYRF